MKVLKQGKSENYEDLYPDTYEFKLCGGSVKPEDRTAPAEKDKGAKAEDAEA